MAEWLRKQPENINSLRANGFKFIINALPKVTYFCQTAAFPQMSIGIAKQSTPFVDIPWAGEKITFSPLTIKFLVQEDMANYTEIYDWMIGLGFPENRTQYAKLLDGKAQTPLEVNKKGGAGQKSDATLIILNSEYKESGNVFFRDCFPISLSGVNFTSTDRDTQYVQAEVTFIYRDYYFERTDKTT